MTSTVSYNYNLWLRETNLYQLQVCRRILSSSQHRSQDMRFAQREEFLQVAFVKPYLCKFCI